MDLLKRITNFRFTAFLAVLLEAGVLAWFKKVDSSHWQLVVGSAIVAFIAAQAWENINGVKAPESET